MKARKIWRETDSRYCSYGFKIWLTGGEIYFGKRHYRFRWAFRDTFSKKDILHREKRGV